MKRAIGKELIGPSKSTFLRCLYVRGYHVNFEGKRYLTFAKKMADACENAWKITGETNGYENERRYVIPADRKPGIQIIRPFWWYGRVYQIA